MFELTWSWWALLGGLLGIGLFIGIIWLGLVFVRWATQHVRPEDPRLDNEDEIDHRFY